MAGVSTTIVFFFALVPALLFSVQTAIGGVTCERLGKSTCAFAVSSAGTRCVLEKKVRRGGRAPQYSCCSSEIGAGEDLANWVESDACVRACGLDRSTVGVSSDALLDGDFTRKLCSPMCYKGCPNVVDLYFNLAAGEGVFLPKLCEEQTVNAPKAMAEIRSSGAAAIAELDGSKTKTNISGEIGATNKLGVTEEDGSSRKVVTNAADVAAQA